MELSHILTMFQNGKSTELTDNLAHVEAWKEYGINRDNLAHVEAWKDMVLTENLAHVEAWKEYGTNR